MRVRDLIAQIVQDFNVDSEVKVADSDGMNHQVLAIIEDGDGNAVFETDVSTFNES